MAEFSLQALSLACGYRDYTGLSVAADGEGILLGEPLRGGWSPVALLWNA